MHPRHRTRWPRSLVLALGLALLLCWAPPPARAEPDLPEAPAALAPLPAAAWTPAAAAHLLRRAGFGGTPADVRALHERGLAGAVAHLVHYEKIPADAGRDMEITLRERPARSAVRDLSQEKRKQVLRAHRRQDQQQYQRLTEWWLRLMVSTPRPLEERMTLFWHGHFTSSFRTVRNSYHMYVQNELLRRHATGSFATLLRDISRDPAMLRYLDGNKNRKGKPNENYAREVMELFTMGEGHYTEKDIQEAARALTGWTFKGNEFVNRVRLHDGGTKTFLGKTGRWDGNDILGIILAQEATAQHIARKIFQYFAHTAPSGEVVAALARQLVAADYKLKPVLETLFRSQVFYAPASRGTQIKSPVVLVASLFRTLGIGPTGQARLARAAETLGQAVFAPPTVKGWDGGLDWITTSHLLNRYNLASAVVGTAQDQRDFMREELARLMERRRELQGKSTELGKEKGGDGSDEGMSPPDEMDTQEDEKARRGRASRRGRGAMRFLQRLRLTTPFDPVAYARRNQLKTAEVYVDHLGHTLLAAPLDADQKTRLVDYLQEDGPIDPTHYTAQDRLRGALKLLVSTPEFQLN